MKCKNKRYSGQTLGVAPLDSTYCMCSVNYPKPQQNTRGQ